MDYAFGGETGLESAWITHRLRIGRIDANMAQSGMNPMTLQYLMGHSDINVTMKVYAHVGLDDVNEELKRMDKFKKAKA